MSRSRNIKPGFFRNDLLAALPYECRLLFIGLWTMADRAGRLEDRPVKIKMELFPADQIDMPEALQSLHDAGFILRYTVDGKDFIQVVNFTKHQNPHIKEAASTIPAPCAYSADTVPASEIPKPAPLIPDSLLLIPDSPLPEPPALDRLVLQARERGRIAAALKAQGVDRVNPAHPAFCEAVAAGVTLQEFVDTAAEFPGKPLPYLCATIKSRRLEAATPKAYPEKPKPPAPNISGTSPAKRPEELESADEAMRKVLAQYPEAARA